MILRPKGDLSISSKTFLEAGGKKRDNHFQIHESISTRSDVKPEERVWGQGRPATLPDGPQHVTAEERGRDLPLEGLMPPREESSVPSCPQTPRERG